MEFSDTVESDSRLIRAFVREHSEPAFAALVKRHMGLVYGVAVRKVANHGVAEEITQNVFIQLAKKAFWLQGRDTLAAWLHQAALLESREWWRAEIRRRSREETAAKLETTFKITAESDQACIGLVDEALLGLREADRRAVLLRFFEGRTNREIGALLGIGEDAARKRIDKGLQVLGTYFRNRGRPVAAAGVLMAAAGANTAPASLAATVLQAGLTIPVGKGTSALIASLLRGCAGLKWAPLALISVIISLPLLWQQASLMAAVQEKIRLSGLLSSIQEQRNQIGLQRSDAETRLRTATNTVALRHGAGNQPDSVSDLDPRLYRWDENAAYVRVPKESLKWLSFDPNNHTWSVGSWPANLQSAIAKDGHVSEVFLQALGVVTNEQQMVEQYMADSVEKYRTFADGQAGIGDASLLDAASPDLVTNSETRVWKIPAVSESTTAWKNQFLSGLDTILGEERTKIFMRQAERDGSVARVFQDFGEISPLIVLTPLPEGGCFLARSIPRNGHPEWSWTRVPISRITTRDDPMESEWIEQYLKRPPPQALVDYLQNWWQQHPETPDQPKK